MPQKLVKFLTAALVVWSGVLLTYTLTINPLIGFFIAFVLWKIMKLNSKKATLVLLLTALIFLSVNYNAAEFVFNALAGITIIQLLRLLPPLKQDTQKNLLPALYVAMLVYYTLRMTLVIEVPEMLQPAHELYLSAAKYLTENPNAVGAITASLLLLNVTIFLKINSDENLLLLTGTIFGMLGLEDMTAIIVLVVVVKVLLKKGVEKEIECKNFVR